MYGACMPCSLRRTPGCSNTYAHIPMHWHGSQVVRIGDPRSVEALSNQSECAHIMPTYRCACRCHQLR